MLTYSPLIMILQIKFWKETTIIMLHYTCQSALRSSVSYIYDLVDWEIFLSLKNKQVLHFLWFNDANLNQ